MSFQPTLADIRNQVMLKLRLDPEDTESASYWIQQAYLEIAQYAAFEWDRTVLLGLQPGDGQFDLPCEVAMLRHIQMLYPDGTRSQPAQQVRGEAILARQQQFDSSDGLASQISYSVMGQFSIMFWPLAGDGQQVQILHTVLPDQLEDDDWPDLAEPYGSKLLEYGALVEGSKFKKDPLMNDFELSYRMWKDNYISWLSRRRGSGSLAFEVWTGADPGPDRLEAESEAWH